MKPTQLKAFVAVSTQMSIRGAAHMLGVSPPAVTKIMRELEAELGAPLIERSVKGVQLTECGAALLPRARLLLDDMRQAREEVAQVRDGTKGHLRIAVSAAFAQTLLVPAFRAVRARRPGVTVYLSESGLSGMLERLRDAQLDFAITHIDPRALGSEFECLPLFPVQLVVGAHRRHPLRKCRRVRDLMQAEWALPGDGSDQWAASVSLFASLGLPLPARVVQGDSIAAALALVSQMNFLGFFVETLSDHVFKAHGIRRLELDDVLPTFHVCVVHRHGSKLTPAALDFIACVRDLSAGAA
ncbi:MAG: LysR substrate-binding domain-containing protein [Ottowia sp.]|uniref:LysR family transcriptional regulator n=1 Tax=Ottowia sp. TaxID=1898956 RepID=UPI003C76E5F4